MFVRQQLDLMDLGRFGQELGRLAHERLRDWAVEMGLPALLGIEGVEDSIRSLVFLEGVPGYRLLFLLSERKSGFQESFHFRIFAGFGFEVSVERVFGHSP